MSTLKSILTTVAAVGLFATATTGMAGRYGDDENRHWESIKKAQQTQAQFDRAQGVAGRSGAEMTIEGRPGRQVYDKPAFPGFHKPGY
jgi:hypothetical protein